MVFKSSATRCQRVSDEAADGVGAAAAEAGMPRANFRHEPGSPIRLEPAATEGRITLVSISAKVQRITGMPGGRNALDSRSMAPPLQINPASTTLGARAARKVARAFESFVVAVLPGRRANLMQCSQEGLWNDYFSKAEHSFDDEWERLIWPLVKDFRFDATLELAPGAGRNTERLATLAKRIYALDYNQYALDQCRERLGERRGDCVITYHRNNGLDLSAVGDGAVTAVYCWDAAVHFDREIIANYVGEFARVLAPGGKGFLHHANLGDGASKNIKQNPGWRSNASAAYVADLCTRVNLRVLKQADIPWRETTDCATVFEKP